MDTILKDLWNVDIEFTKNDRETIREMVDVLEAGSPAGLLKLMATEYREQRRATGDWPTRQEAMRFLKDGVAPTVELLTR